MPTSKRPDMLKVLAELEALRSAIIGEGNGNEARDRFAAKVDRHLGWRVAGSYDVSLEEEMEEISSEPNSVEPLMPCADRGGVS